MRVPKVKLVYDRRHQATPEKEGAVDLRGCFDGNQQFGSTGCKGSARRGERKKEL